MDPSNLSALGLAVEELTNRIARLTVQQIKSDISGLIRSYQSVEPRTAAELPASLTSIPDLQIMDVNAPQMYVKFRCQVCLQEWIVAIPLEKLQTYEPTKRCRWCSSMVWSNPDRAQSRSDQRSKREAYTSGSR